MLAAVGECCDKNKAKGSACVAGLVIECSSVGVDVKVSKLAVAKTGSNCVRSWTQELSHVETQKQYLLIVPIPTENQTKSTRIRINLITNDLIQVLQPSLIVHCLARVEDVVSNLLAVEMQLEGSNACSIGSGTDHALAGWQCEISA